MPNKVKFFLIIWIVIITTRCANQTFSQTKQVYHESWALLVGINKYRHLSPGSQLQFAVNDVMSVRQLLIEKFGFREDHIFTLIDEQATKRAIQDAMSQFTDTKKIHQNDRVLIHFSGHGQTIKRPNGSQMGFLITYDAEIDLNDTTNIAHYYRTCLGMHELNDLSGLIPAKHVLFLVDACYSGAAIRSSRALITPELPNYLEKVASLGARQIVVAGSSGQQVFEEQGHGVFTAKLLEALKYGAADLNNDNVTTVTELGAYLNTKVMEWSDGRQTPYFGRFRDSDLEGEFIFQHQWNAVQSPPEDREPPKIEVLPQGTRAFTVEGIDATAGTTRKRVGIATDNTGVKSVQVNGREVGLIKTDRGWRFEITVDRNEIEIKATDIAGNSQVTYWKPEGFNPLAQSSSSTQHPPPSPSQSSTIVDTEPPKIIILEPENWRDSHSITVRPTERNDRINLVGVASDNVGVTQLEVNHQQRIRKSVTQYNRRPALRFEYPISLKDTTTIEIYAADAAGNSDVVTLTLNVELSNIPEASEASTSEMSEMSEGDDIVLIPAGEFQMGSSRGDSDEKPIHTVYLDAFYIDRHEVTNAQYRKFVEATGHREPLFWGDSRFNEPQQPVVGVSWEDAIAYAKWAGRRLPTEAEWERAAKGGKTGQRFPWGNRPLSPSLVNMGGRVDGYRDTAPVGSFPANPYGLYDMGGNVCEWVADVYPRANASKNGHRVIRGGSWRETFDGTFRCTARRTVPRDKMTTDIGFRCAIDAFPSGR